MYTFIIVDLLIRVFSTLEKPLKKESHFLISRIFITHMVNFSFLLQ